MERWQGKVAIVTGASGGIGKAIALKLVNEGIKVAALARSRDRLQELASINQNIIPFCCDVTDEVALQSQFTEIIKNVGPVHILVNNAGIAHFGLMSDQNPDAWRRLIDTNLMSLCVATKIIITHMREEKIKGQIININSVSGHCVPAMEKPIMGIYPASKHAVTAVTEQLRQEMAYLGTGIKITSLSPGYVYTNIHKDGGDTMNVNGMEPEDVADGVVYILTTKPGLLVETIRVVLKKELDLPIIEIEDPNAKLDGGDVLFTGQEFFVGLSEWTNEGGARAVASAFPEYPCTPIKVKTEALILRDLSNDVVEVPTPRKLKSFVTVGGPCLLCVGAGKECQEVLKRMEREATFRYQTITLPEDEAANVLYLNGTLVHRSESEIPKSFQVFCDKIDTRRSLEMTELAKTSCGLTSSCLLVRRLRICRNL